ncbi:MAG: hypothetical protein ACRC6M_11740 [Microcystaceae cyanobacterium]
MRFYDERDFSFLGIITDTREWSNRLTLAALFSALVNFGIEWNRRNRETDRLAQTEDRRVEEEQRRVEEEQRRVEEEQRRVVHERSATARRIEAEKQATRRTRIEIERDIAFLGFLVDASPENRQKLQQVLLILKAYQDDT